jgi:hypothetical protein
MDKCRHNTTKHQHFSTEGMEFLKKMVKEDGLEEMDQWLDHPTSIR